MTCGSIPLHRVDELMAQMKSAVVEPDLGAMIHGEFAGAERVFLFAPEGGGWRLRATNDDAPSAAQQALWRLDNEGPEAGRYWCERCVELFEGIGSAVLEEAPAPANPLLAGLRSAMPGSPLVGARFPLKVASKPHTAPTSTPPMTRKRS